MIYEDNYAEYLEDTYSLLNRRKVKSGRDAQCHALYDTDESQLTERERLVMMLPVIKYEIEHEMLTTELKDELYLYYKDVEAGKFDDLLGDDEIDTVKKDLLDCYKAVFKE